MSIKLISCKQRDFIYHLDLPGCAILPEQLWQTPQNWSGPLKEETNNIAVCHIKVIHQKLSFDLITAVKYGTYTCM